MEGLLPDDDLVGGGGEVVIRRARRGPPSRVVVATAEEAHEVPRSTGRAVTNAKAAMVEGAWGGRWAARPAGGCGEGRRWVEGGGELGCEGEWKAGLGWLGDKCVV